MQVVSQQRIQEREKELADLRQAAQKLTVSALFHHTLLAF